MVSNLDTELARMCISNRSNAMRTERALTMLMFAAPIQCLPNTAGRSCMTAGIWHGNISTTIKSTTIACSFG